MENASKALIMAAGILVGVMIIGIATYLFTTFAGYSKSTYQKMEDTQIAQFNTQFLKYYGNVSRAYTDEDGEEKIEEGPILCTAQDIITVANLAQQNNNQYDLLDQTEANNDTFYIQVVVLKEKNGNNVEKWTEQQKINFLKNNSTKLNNKSEIKYYTCTKAEISSRTKKVNYIEFEEYKE